MEWIGLKGEPISTITDFPDNTFGFVYRIVHKPTGKSYIGKKVFQFNLKRKLTKKDLELYEGVQGRKPKFKVIQKESDWKTYYGSNTQIKQWVKDGKQEELKREILAWGLDKKHLTYLETKYLFMYEVLEKEEFLNDNILGKFFKKDFDDKPTATLINQ